LVSHLQMSIIPLCTNLETVGGVEFCASAVHSGLKRPDRSPAGGAPNGLPHDS
jgi:hypothetical protein